ncbi:hypothetical protein RRG08_009028 [Elysia crispata]|uniref:Uncharacterized protein n=1 Tax=Elysia crispata TaxID=231223 RepID=A0AAE0Y2P3_9GAST|nr:hypothetical protein RRG08_009028 [Elysia crispata]
MPCRPTRFYPGGNVQNVLHQQPDIKRDIVYNGWRQQSANGGLRPSSLGSAFDLQRTLLRPHGNSSFFFKRCTSRQDDLQGLHQLQGDGVKCYKPESR